MPLANPPTDSPHQAMAAVNAVLLGKNDVVRLAIACLIAGGHPSIAMSKWTPNSAEAMKIALEKPDLIQQDLGKKLGIKQNAVSGRLKRAYFDELTEVDALFRTKIRTLVS